MDEVVWPRISRDFPPHLAALDDLRLMWAQGTAVTDLRRINEKLEKKRTENAALLAAIPDLIVQISEAGKIVGFKAAKDVHLRRPLHECLGRGLSELFPDELARELFRLASEATRLQLTQMLEYRLDGEGGPRDVEARIVANGRQGSLLILRDITERKRMERELVVAREDAFRASRAKSEFLAMSSSSAPRSWTASFRARPGARPLPARAPTRRRRRASTEATSCW